MFPLGLQANLFMGASAVLYYTKICCVVLIRWNRKIKKLGET